MKLNSPIPQPLSKECTKAARICQFFPRLTLYHLLTRHVRSMTVKSFVDGSNNGLDGVIPRSVLENARGFAIFTIFKAGFLFSARAGSGVVIARLDDGRWSAPSAIGTAGVGVGGQAGAEMTDFLIVLNTRSQTFMSAGSLTLGGNLSVALGPLGRNGEALGSVNTNGKVAAMYSYSKTRGLFGGISVEGSVIVERQDANQQAYHSPVTARMLLGGVVEPPEWASYLIRTLESCTGMPGGRRWIQDTGADGHYAFGSVSSPDTEGRSFLKKKKKGQKQSGDVFPPDTWGKRKDSGSFFDSEEDISHQPPRSGRVTDWDADIPSDPFADRFESSSRASRPRFSQSISYSSSSTTPLDMSYDNPAHAHLAHSSHRHSRSLSLAAPASSGTLHSAPSYRSGPFVKPKPELLQPHDGVARAIALYDFSAIEAGDLSFAKGDVIVVTKMSDSSDDWWTGKSGDCQGIFPANRVEVV
ncbi:hypothetical protein H0H92_000258 [Tricholoma furcatifolium]|nr:hypothetical protein H0H92_000258 [Tricholoma furcatifolium]